MLHYLIMALTARAEAYRQIFEYPVEPRGFANREAEELLREREQAEPKLETSETLT